MRRNYILFCASLTGCESKSVVNKAPSFDKVEAEEDIDDPTWDKENDREEDDAFDFSPSSDDDWKPSSDKKRPRREITLFPSEVRYQYRSQIIDMCLNL